MKTLIRLQPFIVLLTMLVVGNNVYSQTNFWEQVNGPFIATTRAIVINSNNEFATILVA